MSFSILLLTVCFSLYFGNGLCSYMGSEELLRQNIADLLDGKLKFSDSDLPFDENELSDTTPKNQSEYDFIVIGAGSAGATIASRLSEVSDVTVLLIEAGGKEYSIMDIPSLAAALGTSDEINWKFETESSDKYCLVQKDHKYKWPRGKVVGGTTILNYMNAMRGNQRDYDIWADETGDETWSSKNMLQYFKKLETFDPRGIKFNKKYHNTNGPVYVRGPSQRVKLIDSFIQAGKEMGYSEIDFNGPEQIGFSYYQSTMFEGERWSVNRAYLRPAKNRSNLHLTRNSFVHKILIDGKSKKAYGVRYSKNGQIYEVNAKKEIILSAGAINSPQILMLSGIGPKRHLRKLNIDLIKDSPVGENLMDHIAYSRVSFSVNDSSTIVQPNILDKEDPSISDYLNYKNGTLSYGVSLGAIAYLNVNDSTDMHSDIEMIFGPGGGMISKPSTTASKKFTLMPMMLRPKSRGKILLRSSNPYDKPKIYPNYLEDPYDVDVLIKAIRFAIRIGETSALKKHGSEYQPISSDCDVYGIGSDKYWECELRFYAMSMYHPAGTCKMGREDDNRAVVNSQLKVIGVHGLRVADASIMPNLICGHINIPVIAIGEKAADSIKMEHGY